MENEEHDKLPLHLPTLLISLVQYLRYLVIAALIAGLAGVGLGLTLGKKTYESKGILSFKPVIKDLAAEELIRELTTNRDLVKIPENLAYVRDSLNLEMSLDAVGKSCVSKLFRKTVLMEISCKAKTPELASQITNVLMTTFTKKQVQNRKAKLQSQILLVEAKFDSANQEYQKINSALNKLRLDNGITDLEAQTQSVIDEVYELNLSYQRAKVEAQDANNQYERLKHILANLQERYSKESEAINNTEDLGEIGIRIKRLKESILDDKTQRANEAELKKYTSQFLRAQELYQSSLISRSAYEEARALYERQTALTIDTEKTAAWREELEKLDKVVIPKNNQGATLTGGVLKAMMLKDLELQLKVNSASQKVEELGRLLEERKKKQFEFSKLKSEVQDLEGKLKAVEKNKDEFSKQLFDLKRAEAIDQSDYITVSKPTLSPFAVKSNRKVIAVGLFALCMMISTALVLLRVLTHTRLESILEAEYLLDSKPLIYELSDQRFEELQNIGIRGFKIPESMNLFTSHYSIPLRNTNNKILFLHQKDNSMQDLFLANFAMSLALREFRVLILEVTTSAKSINHFLGDLGQTTNMGLSQYLGFATLDVKDCIYNTSLPGVSYLPRLAGTLPDGSLSNNRFRQMLEELESRYNVILIQADSALSSAHTPSLLENCSEMFLSLSAGKDSRSELNKINELINKSKVNLRGLMMHGIKSHFVSKESR